jgi:hypothetical protein
MKPYTHRSRVSICVTHGFAATSFRAHHEEETRHPQEDRQAPRREAKKKTAKKQ